MDGDATAKSFEQGANSALKETEMGSGIHESVKQTVRFVCFDNTGDALPDISFSLLLVKRPKEPVQAFLTRLEQLEKCSMV